MMSHTHNQSSTSLLIQLLYPMTVLATLIISVAVTDAPLITAYVILAIIVFFISEQIFSETTLCTSLKACISRQFIKHIFSWCIVILIMLIIGYITGYVYIFPERTMLVWFLITPFALSAAQYVLSVVLVRIFSHAENKKTAVVAGANELGDFLAKTIEGNNHLHIALKGFFDDRDLTRLQGKARENLVGTLNDLPTFIKQNKINILFITLPMTAHPRTLNLLDKLKDTTASVYFVPDVLVTDLIQGRLDQLGGIPVIAICETPFTAWNGFVKRIFDIFLSLLLIILCIPIFIIIAAAVRLSSPGPVIFKQRRYGIDGEEINVYKFRSMTVCEDTGVIVQAKKCDVRVTKIGAIIRKTSLDELPQLFNVLLGSMSLVGPRPHAIFHNEKYRRLIKGYMIRHKVKPGITGWAQVNGFRGETERLEKMENRIRYDIEYLQNWSIMLDVWIIFKTVFILFSRKNAH